MKTGIAHCQHNYPISTSLLWELVRDFYSDWHPAMTWCKKESDGIRQFADLDGKLYREQLVYYRNSKQTYTYKMLEGIPDLDTFGVYVASVEIMKISAENSTLHWNASMTATEATTIAEGTKSVFEMGFAELKNIIQEKAIKTELIQTFESGPKLAIDSVGKGELCLFLHGIGGNRSNWSNQLMELGSICQAVALDIRGYGDSELGTDGIDISIINNDILAIMKLFEADKIHLVGLSFGSWLAASFADTHPEKIASLTLCAGSTGMSEAEQTERDGFANARLEPIKSGVTPAEIADAVVEQISGPHSTEDTKAILHKCMTTLPRETYLAALTCFLNPPKRINFENFNFPTLFISGEHDTLASPKEMQAVAARVPNSQFVEIPKAGHLINLDCPTAYNHTLLNFLKEVMA